MCCKWDERRKCEKCRERAEKELSFFIKNHCTIFILRSGSHLVNILSVWGAETEENVTRQKSLCLSHL